MLSRTLATLLCVALCLPAFAWADPAKANEFYEQAAVEYEKGNYDNAAELLYRAYAEDTNLIYVYNRILALQAGGRLNDALRELKVYENRMMNDSGKRFEDIQDIKAGLEKRIEAREKEDPEVKDPEVKDPDVKDPDVKDPDVKDPEIKDPGTVEPASSGGPGVIGWSLMGGGAVVAGVGFLFSTGVLLSLEATPGPLSSPGSFVVDVSDALEACGDCRQPTMALRNALNAAYPGQDDFTDQLESYKNDVSSIRTNEILTVTLIGVGSAAIIGGVIYWLAGDRDSDSDAKPTATTTSVFDSLAVAPYANTEGGAAVFQLTF